MPRLAVGAPAKIAGEGLAQVGVGNQLEAARAVEARGGLVGDCLDVDKTVFTGGADRLLVQMLRLLRLAADARVFCGDQRRAVLEVLGAALRPLIQLPAVCGQLRRVLGPLLGRYRAVVCGPRERPVEMVFGQLDM